MVVQLLSTSIKRDVVLLHLSTSEYFGLHRLER